MEIYGSLKHFQMVVKVVKNTKISTLSSIILIKFNHRVEKWTILLRYILWEQKAKKKIYLLNIICYTEMVPSSSMQNFMAVWGSVPSEINFFFGGPYMDPWTPWDSKGKGCFNPRDCNFDDVNKIDYSKRP